MSIDLQTIYNNSKEIGKPADHENRR